jgi:hypothetical protein
MVYVAIYFKGGPKKGGTPLRKRYEPGLDRLIMLGFGVRCLFGRLARAMTTNAIFPISKSSIILILH